MANSAKASHCYWIKGVARREPISVEGNSNVDVCFQTILMALQHTHISFAHCYKNQTGMSDEREISLEKSQS